MMVQEVVRRGTSYSIRRLLHYSAASRGRFRALCATIDIVGYNISYTGRLVVLKRWVIRMMMSSFLGVARPLRAALPTCTAIQPEQTTKYHRTVRIQSKLLVKRHLRVTPVMDTKCYPGVAQGSGMFWCELDPRWSGLQGRGDELDYSDGAACSVALLASG